MEKVARVVTSSQYRGSAESATVDRLHDCHFCYTHRKCRPFRPRRMATACTARSPAGSSRISSRRSSAMPPATITIEQIRSPIRRRGDQRKTLIGLRLNRIGRIAELPDTPQTRGMVAKVSHLVRMLYATAELDAFVAEVTAEYRDILIG